MTATVDTEKLEAKVKDLYRDVAQQPQGAFHFELGEPVALRVGYNAERLAVLPSGAVESFAGVGYFFDLAGLAPGDTVVDLGSGSGMDVFYAASLVGPTGRVVGIDFTHEQLEKARRLAATSGATNVEFREGRIEEIPLPDASVDCVISNGVINLCPDKKAVFVEAARAAGVVPHCDRVVRIRGGPSARERLRVHLRAGTQRQRQVRRQEHLGARRPNQLTN